MLVIVSDLHFVDETAGKHNLPSDAFTSVLLEDLASFVKDSDKNIQEIKLLLLGDIFDIIRSQQWLDEGFPLEDRPWGSNGLKDVPNPRSGSITEQMCLRILGQLADGSKSSTGQVNILHKNWEALALFRNFGSRIREASNKTDLKVELDYLPGNHDRIVNLYPSLRAEVRQILGLEGGDRPFSHCFECNSYGVFAMHGHERDKQNFGGLDLKEEDYLAVPIGEVLTTEFAAKIPWKLATKLKEKRFAKIDQQDKDGLIARLKDIDNIRPMNMVLEYVNHRSKGVSSEPLAAAIHESVREVLQDLSEMDFSQIGNLGLKVKIAKDLLSWCARWSPYFLARWLNEIIADLLLNQRLLPAWLACESKNLNPTSDALAQGAIKETHLENPHIYSVVYGHTHIPVEVPLAPREGREVFYINTGSWRPYMVQTIPHRHNSAFVEVKNLTYAIFYNEAEDSCKKRKQTKSFELWTGFKKKYYDAKSF